MSPITHFLVGWVALERLLPSRRDKAAVCLSGVAPDLDGLGIVVDVVTRVGGLAHTDYYQQFHRLYGHGLLAAIFISLVVAGFAHQRRRAALLALAAVHLHFLCDLLGSRGSTADDIWPIYYFSPMLLEPQWSLSFQWPLVGWQNLVISGVLIFLAISRATVTGYSPVFLFSQWADVIFTGVVRKWRTRITRAIK